MTERDDPSGGGLHLFGVRHHGPGSARSVVQAFEAISPDIVLVELPADVQPALRWIGDDGLVPPVAVLGWAVAEPDRAVFAPLARFSPEWQAIRWALDHGVEVRAIDLPLSTTLAASPEGTSSADVLFDGDAPLDPLAALAAAADDPDPERWWEDVIEHRGDGPAAFAAVAEAMVAVRAGSVPSAREARREAHMRRAIRVARREGFVSVAVVVGAWHVPALDLDGEYGAVDAVPTASVDAATLRGMTRSGSRVKTSIAWVPWTHRRLAAGSGYSAGIESPGWYRHVFDHPGHDGVARFFVDAARLLRERGDDASPDHLIAGTRLADALATMRGRPRPGLGEVLDAADAVMGGLDVIRRQLVVGDAIGSVPDGAPQVPLARDVARAQKSARLTPKADVTTVEIDVRTPTGLRKSQLLHRLAALGVPWGSVVEGRGSSGTFRETWELRWEPEWSVRLIERAGYGTTLESAATARLLERAVATDSVTLLVGVIESALFAGLHGAVESAVSRLATRAATDPDIGQLLDALPPLTAALRYGDVRGTDARSLRAVVDGMIARVLAGLSAAARSLDDDAAATFVQRLAGLQGALAVIDHPARHRGLPAVLVDLAVGAGHGLVQGRATRLLHDAGTWSVDAVERRLSRALSGGTPPARGAAFVEGFLAGSGAVIVHDEELLAVLDGWVASLTPESFDAVVPLLRRTFGAFEPAERRQLMTLLAGQGAPRSGGFGDEVDPRRAELALVTVRQMLGLAADEVAS